MIDPDSSFYLEQSKWWDRLEKHRDSILDSLSEADKAAIFQNLDDFIYHYKQENDYVELDDC